MLKKKIARRRKKRRTAGSRQRANDSLRQIPVSCCVYDIASACLIVSQVFDMHRTKPST